MGLANLDKETRAALTEVVREAINGDDALQRVLGFFAEDNKDGIRKLMDQTKDLAESFDEIDAKIAEQERTFGGRLARIQAATRGTYGQYQGAFADEDTARCVGLTIMGHFGNKRAREALQADHKEFFERALSANVISEGGALLAPAELMNTVLWLKELYGVFSSKVPEQPIGSSETVWVKDSGEPYMNVRGELESAITENSFQLARQSLKVREWYSLYFYPRNLEEDAAVSIADMMARRFGWAFAYWMDKCGFMGDGSSTYLGINGIINRLREVGTAGLVAASGVTTFAAVTDTHLLQMQANLPQYADANNAQTGAGRAEYYSHRKFFFEVVTRLARTVGGLTAEEFAGRRRLAYNGSPWNIVQVMPSTGGDTVIPCVHGDLQLACQHGVRRRMTIESNSNVRWLQSQVAVMATMVHDIVVPNVGDANTVEALTALKMAA